MAYNTFTAHTKAKASEVNENFSFLRGTNAINSKIFCQLIDAGELSASEIDNIISNTGLSGTSDNSSTTWSSVLTDFSSGFKYNSNLNKVNNGIIEIAYLNTSGSLIAGRFDLLNGTFSQTHNITIANLPTSSGDATYNTSENSEGSFFMLNSDDELVYGLFTSWEEDDTPDNEALFVDAKVYNSSGTVTQTYSTRLITATAGNQQNAVNVYPMSERCPFYESSGTCKALFPAIVTENNDTDDAEDLYFIKLTYNGTTFSATDTYIYGVGDTSAYMDAGPVLVNDDYLYLVSEGREDDGGSTDEDYIDGRLYKIALSDFSSTTLHTYTDSSCEGPRYDGIVLGDLVYVRGESDSAGGTQNAEQKIYINGAQIYTTDESDPDVDVTFQYLLMPEGFEIYADIQENNIVQQSIFKAYNRIAETSSTITSFSSIGSSAIIDDNDYVFIFEETDGTRHMADITSTTYRVYDQCTGKVSFNDDITDTDVDEIFAYFQPLINSFWSDFKDSVTTGIEVTNGSTTTELEANVWDEYNDTITEIDLTVNSNLGPLVGTSNLGYYLLYDK